MNPTRRNAMILGAGGLALSACSTGAGSQSDAWDTGDVHHIIPAASPDTFLIKVSLKAPISGAVDISIDGRLVTGRKTDSSGRFWSFFIDSLRADTRYALQLLSGGNALCDPWPLSTFPHATSTPEHFRVALHTCAGGLDGMKRPNGMEIFRPHRIRQRLINRALSFQPDALVSNGDHVYWDIRSQLEHSDERNRNAARALFDTYGYFDFEDDFESNHNEAVLNKVAGPQIADLYGTRLRSTPSFFLCDDHDYFENDEYNERMQTFPPEPFLVAAQRATADRYYPRFLPEPSRPNSLPGTDPTTGLSDAFGTLRYGLLFEAQLFDCGRFLSLGKNAGLIPRAVEDWLVARTHDPSLMHLVQIPSHPMGWSAGKWREWYPDVVVDEEMEAGSAVIAQLNQNSGTLSNSHTKYGWQQGWWDQHQRLLVALSAQSGRSAMSVSGDLHAVCNAVINKSGDLDLSSNPVHTILSGPISSSTLTWPSAARGTKPEVPGDLTSDQPIKMLERNGFTILDVTPDTIRVRQFAWDESKGEDEIDTMAPVADYSISSKSNSD